MLKNLDKLFQIVAAIVLKMIIKKESSIYKQKMEINKYSKKIYILFLTIFSFYINFYYGHLGVYPLDTFLFYDSSLRILEGATPFKDFWISTGLTIDIMQAFIFKLFGISFKNYVSHASLMNVALTLATFFIFIEFKLSNFFHFFIL